MCTLVFCVAAGLVRAAGTITVDRDTDRVLRKAIGLAKRIPESTICASAGWSDRFQACMSDVMKQRLLSLGTPEHRILVRKARTFNTDGEIREVVDLLRKSKDPKHTVHLVVRWWHYPRTRFQLWMRLGPELRERTTVVRALAPSWKVYGLLREAPAFLWNARRLIPMFG